MLASIRIPLVIRQQDWIRPVGTINIRIRQRKISGLASKAVLVSSYN